MVGSIVCLDCSLVGDVQCKEEVQLEMMMIDVELELDLLVEAVLGS